MYSFKKVSASEHDAFVKGHEYCNLLQSSAWANIKNNWGHVYYGVYDDETLVCSSLVLIKPLPAGLSMFYLPRGPIVDYTNKRLLQFFFSELKKVAKKRHCLFIKFDPGVLYHAFYLNEEPTDLHVDEILSNIADTGAIHKGFTMDFHSTVQPRFHMVEYKDTFGDEYLTKKGKKNLKNARKQGLDVQIGGKELLDDFCEVMKCTENRKGIQLRDRNYYELLLDTYPSDAFIVLGYINIKKDLDHYTSLLEKCISDIEKCNENQKKKLFTLQEQKVSYENKIKVLEESYEKYGDKTCVSGTLTVCYGSTSEILYAGMNEEFKRYMAPYLVWYTTMEECFCRGCETSNMGGIEGNLEGGLVNFKEVFYPRINEFIGEYDLPVSKVLYSASQVAYKVLKG